MFSPMSIANVKQVGLAATDYGFFRISVDPLSPIKFTLLHFLDRPRFGDL